MEQRDLAAIYDRYHQGLYRFCFSILASREDAQEALQNTMLKALRALPAEQREIKLEPWLYRIAHNESIELLRKRRDVAELDAEQIAAPDEPAETAALRERLRTLFADLGELPTRQRGALVMRELAGLEFKQIGEAFGTSPAVARQTVYEARLSLRQLEAGREMRCEKAMQQLSAADGRVARRRDLRAHLRVCPDCRAFGDAIAARRHDFAAISPLPAAAAAGILHSLIGAQASTTAGLAGAAGAAGAGAGKVAATSVAVKAVATAAAVVTIGVVVADRGGLIDAGLPGVDAGDAVPQEMRSTLPGQAELTGTEEPSRASPQGAISEQTVGGTVGSNRTTADPGNAAQGDTPLGPTPSDPASLNAPSGGPPADLPPASQQGQQTTAERKAGRGSQSAEGHGQAPVTAGQNGKGTGRGQAKPPQGHSPAGAPGKSGSPPSKGGGSAPKGASEGKPPAADTQPPKGGSSPSSEAPKGPPATTPGENTGPKTKGSP